MKKKLSRDELIQVAIDNINQDRESAQELLQDVASHIGQQKDRYATVGMVAAKYLETLQRSNEQLVKLVTLMAKKQDNLYGDLDDEDKKNIYDSFGKET